MIYAAYYLNYEVYTRTIPLIDIAILEQRREEPSRLLEDYLAEREK